MVLLAMVQESNVRICFGELGLNPFRRNWDAPESKRLLLVARLCKKFVTATHLEPSDPWISIPALMGSRNS
jgi:hypothetical protein